MIGDNGDNGNSTVVLARHHGPKTRHTDAKYSVERPNLQNQAFSMFAASSGAITMQLNYCLTSSVRALAAVAVVAITTGSASADGYQRGGVVPVAGCANFGGFYVGGNIGGASLTAHQADLDGIFAKGVATGFTATDDSFTAGAQVGYNVQKRCTVFGIEADWNWADLNADTRLFPIVGLNDSLRTRIDNFGTIRTRTGIVVDQLLLFVTGGVAWTETRDSVNRAVGLVTERFSSNDTRWGWTAGFGTEYALAPGVSLTSDVLYLSFNDEDHTFDSPTFGRFRTKTDEEIWVARMGLNIRFGDRGAIVVPPLK
jgi:outer membrane immunogenic protein